jgi:hypothetical protein
MIQAKIEIPNLSILKNSVIFKKEQSITQLSLEFCFFFGTDSAG